MAAHKDMLRWQLQQERRVALRAWEELRAVIQIRRAHDRSEEIRVAGEAFTTTESFLFAAGVISKILFPEQRWRRKLVGYERRLLRARSELRREAGVRPASPLRETEGRDCFAHVDERMSSWTWKVHTSHPAGNLNLTPWIVVSSKHPAFAQAVRESFLLLDPTHMRLKTISRRLRRHTVDLKRIHDEIVRMNPRFLRTPHALGVEGLRSLRSRA